MRTTNVHYMSRGLTKWPNNPIKSLLLLEKLLQLGAKVRVSCEPRSGVNMLAGVNGMH